MDKRDSKKMNGFIKNKINDFLQIYIFFGKLEGINDDPAKNPLFPDEEKYFRTFVQF